MTTVTIEAQTDAETLPSETMKQPSDHQIPDLLTYYITSSQSLTRRRWQYSSEVTAGSRRISDLLERFRMPQAVSTRTDRVIRSLPGNVFMITPSFHRLRLLPQETRGRRFLIAVAHKPQLASPIVAQTPFKSWRRSECGGYWEL
ncbi:hypothetical protein T01_9142 [Trichinella spiralis]|uniref:Uncharacterized protein n=1 Tax=Trichinella spiralis TaxID=6334 RepID=A0A0V1BGY7_TRISP|nr:hypothetical protein T01_9142 [Trichinella spiralis]